MTSILRQLPRIALLTASLAGLSHSALAQEVELIPSGDLTFDQNTGEIVATDGAQIQYGEWLLSADTIRFNQETKDASATGHVVFTRADLRLTADSLTYKPAEEFARATNFRAGNGRVYVDGAVLEGNPDNFRFEEINFYPGEPGTFLFIARAGELSIVNQNEIRGKKLFFKVGAVPFLLIPNITQPLDAETNLFKPTLDYSGHIGAAIGAEALAPVTDHIRLGGNVTLTSKRGILAGPAASYSFENESYVTDGSFISGYINDQGEPGLDINGATISDQRYFAEWQHKQIWNDNQANISAYARYWSDSEVTRDFYEDSFDRMQDPDSYIEANYNGQNWQASLFARAALGDFQSYTERLPEVRFSYFPTNLGYGFSHSAYLSAAKIGVDATEDVNLTGTKADLFYGVEWNHILTDGIGLRVKAGARNISYQDAETYLQSEALYDEADTFVYRDSVDGSRAFGDLGVDLNMKAYSTFDFQNETWNIDGLRHIIEPRISYRYTPELWSSGDLEQSVVLPAIYGFEYGNSVMYADQGTFANYLPSIDLENRRDSDYLREDHKIRFELGNRLQTRGEDGGARDLARFDIAADYYLGGSDYAEDSYSLLSLDLELTPAPWLEFGLFNRLDPEGGLSTQELNSYIAIKDPGYWKIAFGSHYLKGPSSLTESYFSTAYSYPSFYYSWVGWPTYGMGSYTYPNQRLEQYFAHIEYQLSENFKLYATARYDDESGVFYEQRIGLMQRALENYGLKYELRIYDGDRRESDFGISIAIDLFDE
ncbi:putative LPS assembly protein LptD [Pelagicoccus albus]|uniref:LPS-assembly protein LptD n=1 Tax=Pelagicoccus albus TaxID=415222 RepID=A0A7X1B3L5_9BACT|nr:putative LPS assembly protein LptD [Pelagicoccus albus]MBC2604892.1 LPS-assembly protein LptD [Pelagicoccus albus]